MNATRTTNLLHTAARAIENADNRYAQRAIRLALREMTRLYAYPFQRRNRGWESSARLAIGL